MGRSPGRLQSMFNQVVLWSFNGANWRSLRRTFRVHAHLLSKHEWIEDLHLADVIFVAAHSQGSVVSIHLLDKLIREGHILTPRNIDILNTTAAMVAPGGAAPASTARTQRICCLALCGIHLGPLRYLKTSSLLQPYIQVGVHAFSGSWSSDDRDPVVLRKRCSSGAIWVPGRSVILVILDRFWRDGTRLEHREPAVKGLCQCSSYSYGAWGRSLTLFVSYPDSMMIWYPPFFRRRWSM